MGQSPNGACYTDNPNDAVLVQGNADLKDGWVSPRVWTTEITKTAKSGDLIMSVRAPLAQWEKPLMTWSLAAASPELPVMSFCFRPYLKRNPRGIGLPFPLVRLLTLSMEMNSGIRRSIVPAVNQSARRLATVCLRLIPSSPFISVWVPSSAFAHMDQEPISRPLFKDSFGYYATRAPSRRCSCRHRRQLQASSAQPRAPSFAVLLPLVRLSVR